MMRPICLVSFQADVFPGLAAVIRSVHTIAKLYRVAQVGFAGADVNRIWIGRRDRDCPDRGRRRGIEDRSPGAAGVDGFPDAATD